MFLLFMKYFNNMYCFANTAVAVYWPKQMFSVNNCQILSVNIGAFWLLETDGGYIKSSSSLPTMGHVTMKVNLKINSENHINICCQTQSKQLHNLLQQMAVG